MKALVFDINIPKYLITKITRQYYGGLFSPLKLNDIPEVKLTQSNWAKIKTIYCGICGSDISTIFLKMSPALMSFSSFPTVLGHEIVGKIVEIKETEGNFKIGDRVVIEPYITCRVREITPECSSCKSGNYNLCQNIPGGGKLSPGMVIGNCHDVGGGFSEYFLAHTSQLIKLPDNIDDLTAVLIEPLSVGLHAVLREKPTASSKVLVIGGGMISYSVIIALRLLGINCHITQMNLFTYQKEIGELFGIDDCICKEEGDNLIEKVNKITGAKSYKTVFKDYVFVGGFDYVYDCIGSNQSLKDAIRLTKEGGYLIMIGATSIIHSLDLTFLWQKELNIIGSYGCSYETYNGKRIKTIELMIEKLQNTTLPIGKLVTHKFTLTQYKQAIEANINRSKFNSIKTVFEF